MYIKYIPHLLPASSRKPCAPLHGVRSAAPSINCEQEDTGRVCCLQLILIDAEVSTALQTHQPYMPSKANDYTIGPGYNQDTTRKNNLYTPTVERDGKGTQTCSIYVYVNIYIYISRMTLKSKKQQHRIKEHEPSTNTSFHQQMHK